MKPVNAYLFFLRVPVGIYFGGLVCPDEFYVKQTSGRETGNMNGGGPVPHNLQHYLRVQS